MTDAVIVAVLSLIGTLIGSFTAGKMTTYRIDQLEKKVDKHNQVVEKFVVLEKEEQVQSKQIEDLWDDLEKIKEEVWRSNEQ